ncbi:glucose-1-phosphate thymidylyltransferase [Pedobacter sp. PACM 27299]|uniref:putative sugar nucleotidyl transferase n=1 Tax=Pedobacter sp. PACM 27299 TaxID=1727164 RepID=UPI000706081C|nr:putative sugar nucleotidyl transferase [Pedobacter sp. PACM 27299]ALL07487.1 glucose-1-phosphate thymidylyltransferase [Pedobacter sp. PACM 27299]
MTINLFDDNAWASLRPLSFTRPVADLRVGILTIAQKWEQHLNAKTGYLTVPYLSVKYPAQPDASLSINGSVCPDEGLLEAIDRLRDGEVLKQEDLLLAYRAPFGTSPEELNALKSVAYEPSIIRILHPEDIFKNNDIELRKDFSLLTKGRSSAILSSTNVILGDQVFVEEGGGAECATLNSLNGPIYIGKNSQIWEGAHIRGSFALCHDSQVKMGAKIYGQTTIGPFSRVGGEINNAVIWGYSSKGHEGYLGNSVMGQWCNIGADTNNSNLKNNYAPVKIWDYTQDDFRETGLLFCGMIMADHAKCGINTMFNTGSVIGVGANVFGAGFPKTFLPDFSWGGAQGFETYRLDKMFETAEQVLKRRNLPFEEVERNILTAVFELTKSYRS